jgi:hypothetical protein
MLKRTTVVTRVAVLLGITLALGPLGLSQPAKAQCCELWHTVWVPPEWNLSHWTATACATGAAVAGVAPEVVIGFRVVVLSVPSPNAVRFAALDFALAMVRARS